MATLTCTRCGKQLTAPSPVWLELDQRTDTFTKEDVPNEFSQGGFPFGGTCARQALDADRQARTTPVNEESTPA